MFYLQGQNANGSVIAVTSTATNLYDLINTAASTTLERAGYSFKANGINILPEDGDVRILFDSTLSPTASKGMLLTAGTQYFLRNVPLDKMKLIRTGGTNVSCSIGIGICDATETSTAVAGVGSSALVEAVDVAKIGGAATAAAAALADATANPTVGSFGSYTETYNGTTWDRARGGQTSNSATVTGMANVLSMARYDSSPTARTTGQFGNLQADANGDLQTNLATLISGEDQTNGVLATVVKPLAVNTYASTKTQSNSFTTTNLKGAPGTLLGFRVINTTASTRYLQFHNTATTPGGGATAQEKWLIPANGSLTIGSADLPINGLYFSTGIAYANSTVNSTYTAGSAGDLLLDVNFI